MLRNMCTHTHTHTHIYIYIYIHVLSPYWLTPCSTVLLEKLTGLQLVKKFPAFYGTRRFITTFTSTSNLSLSRSSSIQSISLHPTTCRTILILSSHLRLGLPSGLIPWLSHQNPAQAPPPYAIHAPPISYVCIYIRTHTHTHIYIWAGRGMWRIYIYIYIYIELYIVTF